MHDGHSVDGWRREMQMVTLIVGSAGLFVWDYVHMGLEL